jgi:beta propeller repeat protein
MRPTRVIDVTTTAALSAAAVLLVSLHGCERQVTVHGEGENTSPIHANAGSGASQEGEASAGRAGDGSAISGGARAGTGASADASADDAGGSASDPGAAGSIGTDDGTGLPAGGHLMDGIDQSAQGDAAITDLEIMYQPLGAIELPAVGDQAVSLTQYPRPTAAATLHVAGGNATWWHESMRAYYVYSAANGERFVDLLQTAGTFGIHADGDANDISGTPASYKEFLSANADGFAWVDYGMMAAGPAGGPPMMAGATFGAVVFKRWSGARSEVTDALRYRARIDLSSTHVAFVEYADTAPGTVGQIVVQPLAGGDPIAAAPSANHQDRPAIDGDWVVWEEYVGGDDAVIRARNLATGEVRDVSERTGFRTNPDIQGTRVVWEDQRSGDGDIYYVDLTENDGDHVAVSGAGHSTAVRLNPDGIVWIEVRDDAMGLMRARWAR